jgi:signal transduction histidine kinase
VHGLYAWLRRHPKLVDGPLALLVLGFGLSFYGSWARHPALIPVIVALAIPIVFRRQYPTAAFAAVVAVGAVQIVAFGFPTTADVSVLVLLYSLAVSRPRRASAPGLAICVLGAAVAAVRWRAAGGATPWQVPLTLGLVSAPALLTWLAADSVRWRRGYYAALEEKTHRLERERDALAQVAAAAERARIARELHDIVAHHVSVMVVQADGAAFALENSPDKTREALGAISGTGRQALAEMRRLLGMLRSPAAGPELAPVPGTSQLSALLEQTRAAGVPVSFSLEGTPVASRAGRADGADLAVYRVVQEALTNVRRHGGPGASAEVSIRYTADSVTVGVTDDGRGAAAQLPAAAVTEAGGPEAASTEAAGTEAAGTEAATTGHGLHGMRERVELYGGTVMAGPRPGGGYQVTATLPLTSAELTRGAA